MFVDTSRYSSVGGTDAMPVMLRKTLISTCTAPPADEDPGEAVGANRAYPTLGEGVCVRRLNRRADHLDAFCPEDLVEGAAEFRVAIVEEEPERLLVRELHGEVARPLGDPASVRVRCRRRTRSVGSRAR